MMMSLCVGAEAPLRWCTRAEDSTGTRHQTERRRGDASRPACAAEAKPTRLA